jgi:hypothetical protein
VLFSDFGFAFGYVLGEVPMPADRARLAILHHDVNQFCRNSYHPSAAVAQFLDG